MKDGLTSKGRQSLCHNIPPFELFFCKESSNEFRNARVVQTYAKVCAFFLEAILKPIANQFDAETFP